jgi:hypothetical protein
MAGSKLDYAEIKSLGHWIGGTAAPAPPATLYLALHLATTLNSAISAGATSITVPDHIPNGSVITLGVGLGTQENVTVSNITGAGPYTVTISAAANAHNGGEYVKYAPTEAAVDLHEPSGGAYARAAVTNNTTNFPTPSGSPTQTSNTGTVSYTTPSANWGMVTHVLAMDAASGGNGLYWADLATPQIIQTGNAVSFAPGALVFQED